jgi:hypothetical protein
MGPQGPQGPAGNLALAGQSCPDGYFVSGFDQSGNIQCSLPVYTPPNGGGPYTISVSPDGQLIVDYLAGLAGTEFNQSFTNTVSSGTGTDASVTIDILGAAFCAPPNPNAPPLTGSLPLYGCQTDVSAAFVTTDAQTLAITVTIPKLFVDFGISGEIIATTPVPVSGDAYFLFDNMVIVFSAPLLDPVTGLPSSIPSGPKTLGPLSLVSVQQDNLTYELHMVPTLLNSFGEQFKSIIITSFLDGFGQAITAALAPQVPQQVMLTVN